MRGSLQPTTFLFRLRWMIRGLLCRRGTWALISPSGNVRLRVCEGCHRVALDVSGAEAIVLGHERDLPALLSGFEWWLREAGLEAEASELRQLASEVGS